MTEFYREQVEKFEAELKNLMAKYQIEIEYAAFRLGGFTYEWDD